MATINDQESLRSIREKLNATIQPFPTRAAFEAAEIPGAIELVHAFDAGDLWQLVRDPTGATPGAWTAGDNSKWVPTIAASSTESALQAYADAAAASAAAAATALALVRAELVSPTVADMVANTALVAGDRVRTLGYYEPYDGGNAEYLISSTFVGTPDDKIDHALALPNLVAVYQHNGEFNAQACGVRKGVESGDLWNNAFWRAAALAIAQDATVDKPVRFVCMIDVITSKTLHMSGQPATAFEDGASVRNMDVYHPGAIQAVGGGDFETHLNAEMARLTTLHGSSVTLGSALAAKFLKADPQIPEFLGDKIERPIPALNMSIRAGRIYLGDVDCDFWCSGVRINACGQSRLDGYPSVTNFRKYGFLYTKKTNNDMKAFNIISKQWAQQDWTDHGGRMMPGGYAEPRNMTGDALVVLQKDIMWFGGNFGWGRTAITLLDKCSEVESDRWAGRTMYPDYFTRWNNTVWNNHGGTINQPQWDRMAPSTGCGDCNFYGTHVMQGSALDEDDSVIFRRDGLDFGGQTGVENWSTTNPVNFYGLDIDSSITQLFGTNIRFFGPTSGVGNTRATACFHPHVRLYPARNASPKAAQFVDWTSSIGFFPFDRGDVGAPDVVAFAGNYDAWNYRNRVDSGPWTGPVTYRGEINGGTGNLPSGSVVAPGDFFFITQDGTYGGQAMLAGDLLYALTLAPGTSYGANWYLGSATDVDAKNQKRTVELGKPVNVLIGNETGQPSWWLTKAEGDTDIRLETATAQVDISFDGNNLNVTQPVLNRSSASPAGYGLGAGGSVTQTGSRTNSVSIDKPCGEIQLVSAAGSPTPFSFTVNNTTVSAFDNVSVTQRSGTNRYRADVTRVNANNFEVTVTAIVGTDVDAPIFNFEIRNGTNA